MHSLSRPLAIAVSVLAACRFCRHGISAITPEPREVQLQLAKLLRRRRYLDALDAFERGQAARTMPASGATRATGSVQSALRVAEFAHAQAEAQRLAQGGRRRRRGDGALRRRAVGVGLFEEAEKRYEDALAISRPATRAPCTAWRAPRRPQQAHRRDGRGAGGARHSPRDLEIHHTVGAIYERMHKYEEAAGAFTNYVNLLPNKDHSEKAAWSRAEIRFLRSFGQRVPFEIDPGAERQALHGRLPPGERQDRGAGEGQRRLVAGLRRRHRRREHRHLARDRRSASASRRSPTRSAPASATSACAACSSRGSTRSSSAR